MHFKRWGTVVCIVIVSVQLPWAMRLAGNRKRFRGSWMRSCGCLSKGWSKPFENPDISVHVDFVCCFRQRYLIQVVYLQKTFEAFGVVKFLDRQTQDIHFLWFQGEWIRCQPRDVLWSFHVSSSTKLCLYIPASILRHRSPVYAWRSLHWDALKAEECRQSVLRVCRKVTDMSMILPSHWQMTLPQQRLLYLSIKPLRRPKNIKVSIVILDEFNLCMPL